MPRKNGKLKANKTFLIVVEGYTEEIYFSDFKSNSNIHGVTVTPKIAKHSDLDTILKTAITEFESGVYDSVWCVFDRDSIIANGMSEDISKLYSSAIDMGIKFADSMPSFEVWFLLHYVMPKKFYCSQDAVIKELKKHINGYTKKRKWLLSEKLYSKLKPYFDTAMKNSIKLNNKREEKEDEKATLCNVYKLFEELLEVVEK